ncbi:MAG: hypothetical protein ACOYOS_12285 [Syntrophales bacterium]
MLDHMYDNATTWNPFKGCLFNCIYCKPSFQAQAKRQKQRCMNCYNYVPHIHEDRLGKIPSAEIVFVCGNSDISFCNPVFTRRIINAVRHHNVRCPDKTYFFQSKKPEYFEQFLSEFPENVILLTTLETNRDEGYGKIAEAPLPSDRYRQLLNLDYPRKVVTIEPVLDFDLEIFSRWVLDLAPEYVWIGYNSRPKQVNLPEPSKDKLLRFINILHNNGVMIKGKDLRGLTVPFGEN